MEKFTLSLLIIKEVTKKHPYLKKIAEKMIRDSMGGKPLPANSH
jgi:hypothetical protein